MPEPVSEPQIVDPKGAEPLTKRVVQLSLASHESFDLCPFWVGVFKRGTNLTLELFAVESIENLLADVSVNGLAESEPVMMANTESSPPHFVYLLPSPGESGRSGDETVASIVTTIRSWAPSQVGFYFAPDHFEAGESLDFLLETVASVIRATAISTLFLMPGKHGINSVLNVALKIKFDLESEHLDLKVFH